MIDCHDLCSLLMSIEMKRLMQIWICGENEPMCWAQNEFEKLAACIQPGLYQYELGRYWVEHSDQYINTVNINSNTGHRQWRNQGSICWKCFSTADMYCQMKIAVVRTVPNRQLKLIDYCCNDLPKKKIKEALNHFMLDLFSSEWRNFQDSKQNGDRASSLTMNTDASVLYIPAQFHTTTYVLRIRVACRYVYERCIYTSHIAVYLFANRTS